MLLRYMSMFKNTKQIILFKIFLNLIILYIFSIIYHKYRIHFTEGNNKIKSKSDSLYFSLVIHSCLGLGDILPNFKKDDKTGRNIIMIHLFIVILIFSI